MLTHDWLHSNIVRAFLNPLQATHRIYNVLPPSIIAYIYDIALYLFVPFFLLMYLATGKHKKEILLKPALLYCIFAVTVITIMHTKASGLMHHAVLSFPFLIIAMCATVNLLRTSRPIIRYMAMIWGIVFLLMNVMYFARFPQQDILLESDPSKEVLRDVLDNPLVSQKYIYVNVDWGMYFYQGLYGPPDESVVFWWGMRNPDQVLHLKEIATRIGRKILFIYTQPQTSADIPLLSGAFSTVRCDAVPPEARWQIMGEDDPTLRNACNRTLY